MNTEAITTEATPEEPEFPVKARYLLFLLIVLPFIFGLAASSIWPEGSDMASLGASIMNLCSEILLVLTMIVICLMEKVNIFSLIGRMPAIRSVLKFLLLLVPLLAVSYGSVYVIFWPLSYIAPDFVQSWLAEDPAFSGFDVLNPFFSQSIYFLMLVIIAPVVEEFIFRGLLLNRWATKWDVPSAVFATSMLFGFLHSNVVGIAIFGFIMAVLYLKTRTLIVPIALHAANNLIAFLSDLTISDAGEADYSIEGFQSEWWLGVMCLVVGIPWLVYFVRKNWLKNNYRSPYFVNLRGKVVTVSQPETAS